MIDRVGAGLAATVTSSAGPRRPVRRGRMVVMAFAAATIAAVALVIVVAQAGGGGARLVVYDVEEGRSVYERSVEVGERFELTHTHSVTERRVIETFSVLDPSTIAIEELWFDEHGANLPTGPEQVGDTTTTYLEEPDGYRVLHHGHPIGTLPLLVGSPGVDHVLRFDDGERLRLLDVARAGARIEVSLDGQR